MRLSTGLRSSTVFALLSFSAFASPALAGSDLPPVKVSDGNAVAECATPGRLMSFIKARNPNYDAKFEQIATEYMRHGEELGLRWDYGFFQMLVETGFLSFTGDVKPDQNNFAGLGTTGGGVKGEKFKDVSDGARAHLEHLAMYSGQKIENPVAERTKNIQDWEVLTKWQKSIKGPMTFGQVAKQWAPTTRSYASDIQAVAERFMKGACKDADPNPERVAEAHKGKAGTLPEPVKVADQADVAKPEAAKETVTAEAAVTAPTATATVPSMTKGDELAKRANDEARSEGAAKSGLGVGSIVTAAAAALGVGEASTSPEVKILNAAPAVEATEGAAVAAKVSEATSKSGEATSKSGEASVEMASLTSIGKPGIKSEADAKASKAEKSAAGGKCKVLTASYGGESAVIVKATIDAVVNYTVLHVNSGSEKREADAYIAAYAKGGETVGSDFKNQDQALDKAFELCPEG